MNDNVLIENKYQNIEYKKNNPFIFKSLSSKKSFHNWYNAIKYTIVIIAFIFSLLALWYTSQWKNETLTKLGVNLNSFNFSTIDGFTWGATWTASISDANKLSLAAWAGSSSTINETIINTLIALSFVCVVSIIPSLVFKNGTLLSLIWLSITFISAIVVIALFVIGLNAQMEVISLYQNNDINQIKGSYDANVNRISTINQILTKPDANISAEEIEKLTNERFNLDKLNEELIGKLNAEVKRVVEGILKLTKGSI